MSRRTALVVSGVGALIGSAGILVLIALGNYRGAFVMILFGLPLVMIIRDLVRDVQTPYPPLWLVAVVGVPVIVIGSVQLVRGEWLSGAIILAFGVFPFGWRERQRRSVARREQQT